MVVRFLIFGGVSKSHSLNGGPTSAFASAVSECSPHLLQHLSFENNHPDIVNNISSWLQLFIFLTTEWHRASF